MSDHWQVIEDALEGKRALERILSDERDGGAHQRNMARIDAALAFVREMRQGQQPLDAPDSPGWWAFGGHWTTARPEKAVVFHHVYDIYKMTDGQWYFWADDDDHSARELTGKWYRLAMPWDAQPKEGEA